SAGSVFPYGRLRRLCHSAQAHGGVLGARDPEGITRLGWLGLVDLGEYPGLGDLAARLAALRGATAAGP
ncbi:hypothetical protein AB0J37_39685, partial [Microbispora rosea]|uniref:hypothetical protein n=1 Tax=Microbispora rosea TaxID=58117 RepID=UPI00341A065D